MTAIIIVGRLCAIAIVQTLFSMCSKTKDVQFKELLFISWGGMIRGAIAFGLVLKIPDDNTFRERGYVVTTTLSVVIITTLFFGSFMPVV
jgi:NhaP-type Na+/H+ or K+/H+ antiporter